MASGQSSKASNGASGISTRSRTRQRDNQKTPGKRSTSGASTLTSPTSQLDEYFPPRKSQRLAGKYAKNSFRQAREHGNVSYVPPLTGLLGTIPLEALEQILGYCSSRELGALEATCQYFIKSGITERVAQHFLKEIPRAKGLKPEFRQGETSVTLLNFVNGQSAAAAQGTAVALGTYHTVALAADTSDASGPEYAMFAMGRGFHGQLGNGNYDDCYVPTRVDQVDRDRPVRLYKGQPDDIHLAVVAGGSSHAASISRRGELYTWGLASSGELGHGGWTPIEVAVPRMVGSLGRTRVVSVCAGANHTMAISETGQLWTCGRGRHGQLGHGHFHDEGLLTLVETIRHERIVSAAAGKAHSMALAADGKIFTWGDARMGQLGHQHLAPLMQGPNPQPIAMPVPQAILSLEPSRLRPPQRVTAIAAGGNHSMAVTVGGTLLAFGSNKHGQLGTGDKMDRVVPTEVPLLGNGSEGSCSVRAMQVQCGAAHTVALVQHRGRMEVRTAGNNTYGQLGLGHRNEQVTFQAVKALSKARVVCIVTGDWHNAAVTHDGCLYTWGRGDCGQLGHGDDRNRWAPMLVQGFRVVHPDRTLRRNRKPSLKALLLPAAEQARPAGRCQRNGRRGSG